MHSKKLEIAPILDIMRDNVEMVSAMHAHLRPINLIGGGDRILSNEAISTKCRPK